MRSRNPLIVADSRSNSSLVPLQRQAALRGLLGCSRAVVSMMRAMGRVARPASQYPPIGEIKSVTEPTTMSKLR